MPISLHARRLVTCAIVRLRNLAGDERCAARIERYLVWGGPGEMAEPIGAGGGEAGARIRQALAQMPPLTRAVLAVVVGRRLSVAQVSRRFGISEARVRWHFAGRSRSWRSVEKYAEPVRTCTNPDQHFRGDHGLRLPHQWHRRGHSRMSASECRAADYGHRTDVYAPSVNTNIADIWRQLKHINSRVCSWCGARGTLALSGVSRKMTPARIARMHDIIIVGGGPAGMVAGLLFARAGIRVLVLEKHADFFRDFRGDTVHPSTMEILDQLGLLERFLQRSHNRIDHAELQVAGRTWRIGDLSHLPTPAPFIAMMPQWDFLDFIRDEAQAYPCFSLEMSCPVEGIIEQRDRVAGVRLGDGRELRARLTIAADGRTSLVRSLLPLHTLGSVIDVLWFRVAKTSRESGGLRGNVQRGAVLVMIDRGDYWQCAFVIAKGTAAELKARGIAHIRAAIARAAPDLDTSELNDLDQIKLLSVALDRLDRWWKPGLVAIGDAAHAMSPIGGVGINLAVQDAVAAANALARPLAGGQDLDPLLGLIQKRRMLPTRLIQAAQKLAQDRVIGRMIEPGEPIGEAPMIVRLLNRFPALQQIPGRLIGLGIRRERVRSPAV